MDSAVIQNTSFKKKKATVIILSLFGTMLIFVGCLFQFYALDFVVDKLVAEKRQLVEGNKIFEVFKKTPKMSLKATFFNLTNPREILQGATPQMEEIGPYIYELYFSRINLEDIDNDTWKYRIKKETFFNESASSPLNENDLITTIDILLMIILKRLQNLHPYEIQIQEELRNLFNNSKSPFYEVSVKQLLFSGIPLNCNNTVISNVCKFFSVRTNDLFWKKSENSPNYLFSIFHSMNLTDPKWLTADKGIKDTSLTGVIKTISGSSSLATWNDDTCDNLDTSDHFMPPLRNNTKYLNIFIAQVCAKMLLESEGTVYYKGLKLTRFKVTDRSLGSKEVNSRNKCFCRHTLKGIQCPPHGIIDTTACNGFPIMVSSPKLTYVNETLSRKLFGDTFPHPPVASYVDVEPLSGMIVSGRKRLQFNIELNNYSYPGLASVRNILLPILMVEEEIDLTDEDLYDVKILVYTYNWMELALYAVIGLGFLCNIGAVFLIRSNNKSEKIHLVKYDCHLYF